MRHSDKTESLCAKKQTENTQAYPYQERACKNIEKTFVSTAKVKQKKKKKRKKERRRERGEEKKTDIKHKFADKQSELKWTINNEFHGTQFDK